MGKPTKEELLSKIKTRIEELDIGESESPMTIEDDWPWGMFDLVCIEIIDKEIVGTNDKNELVQIKNFNEDDLIFILLTLDESAISYLE